MALVYPAPLPILAYFVSGLSGGPLCSGRVAQFRPEPWPSLLRKTQICEIEAIGYLALAQERYPDIVKKLVATEGLENEQNRIFFINLTKN